MLCCDVVCIISLSFALSHAHPRIMEVCDLFFNYRFYLRLQVSLTFFCAVSLCTCAYMVYVIGGSEWLHTYMWSMAVS